MTNRDSKGRFKEKLIDGFQTMKHPNRNSWECMIQRTTNKKDKDYKKYYGVKGIKVCKRWKTFKNFCTDMGIKPSSEYSIDRIDNSKGYIKSNCEWATRRQQALNRNTAKGERHGMCKLSDLDITNIRKIYATNMYTQECIARKFNITQTHVWRVVRNKSR